MLVPYQTVVLVMAGWLLLLALAFYLLMQRVIARRAAVVLIGTTVAAMCRGSQRSQWFVPAQWHPWLATHRGSSNGEPPLRTWQRFACDSLT